MLMPTLFPGELATKERPYSSLASMWTEFANLKHHTTPALNGEAFTSASQASSSDVPHYRAPLAPSGSTVRRPGRPSPHDVASVSTAHSRRDPFSVDYGLWPFVDRDYTIVCTVTNHMIHTNLSLWTPLLTEEARRRACIQHRGHCCNCGCPAPFQHVFSLLNPKFTTHDTGGSKFETWKTRMRNWRRKGPQHRHQGNGRRHTPRNSTSRPHKTGHSPAPQGNTAGAMTAPNVVAPPAPPLAPSNAPTPAPAPPTMRYGLTYSANSNPNNRQPDTVRE